MAGPLLELNRLSRVYPAGDQVISALKDVSLTIEAGEMVAIVGASGSGKSTLMNGGQLILADEPTGALDSRSGAELMTVLEELNAEGHTVIIVTHDMQVAEHARRIIEIKDGEIIADRQTGKAAPANMQRLAPVAARASVTAWMDRLVEAFNMALTAMDAHRTRAFLTMLGIIIGIASVVSVVALGSGSQQLILKQISSIGTNTVDVYPGKDFGDEKASSIHTLTSDDADALKSQSFVDSVTPTATTSVTLRYRDVSAAGTVNGVGEQYFRVRDMPMAQGKVFDRSAVRQLSQDVIIDDNTQRKLFGDNVNSLGAVILLGSVPCRVIGVAAHKDSPFGNGANLNVYVPYTTVLGRMLGQSYLRNITVRLTEGAPSDVASTAIVTLLTARHGLKDVYTFSTDTIRKTIQRTTQTLTTLIAAIALISLIVGGIGVMNIMLVSVTERTMEIGVRTAVGARRSDIMSQFMIEAALLCLIGGGLGVGLALLIASAINKIAGDSFSMIISPMSIAVAFAFSTLIGLVFGFMPARNAARLDPVEALARE